MPNIFYQLCGIFFAIGGIIREGRPKNNLLSFENLFRNLISMYFYAIIYLHPTCIPKLYAI